MAVTGDVSLPGLGLSSEDRARLVRDVQVVFHAAATINFNAALATAVNINVLGTRRVLQLCKDMPSLKVSVAPTLGRDCRKRSVLIFDSLWQAMVYLSTAYCNSTLHDTVRERVYPSGHDPNSIISIVQDTDPEALKDMTPRSVRTSSTSAVLLRRAQVVATH